MGGRRNTEAPERCNGVKKKGGRKKVSGSKRVGLGRGRVMRNQEEPDKQEQSVRKLRGQSELRKHSEAKVGTGLSGMIGLSDKGLN
jgi:hypothetical protein